MLITKERVKSYGMWRNSDSEYIIAFLKTIWLINFKMRSLLLFGNTDGRMKQGCIKIFFMVLCTAAMKASDLVLIRHSLM
jgi:hypothetical protein